MTPKEILGKKLYSPLDISNLLQLSLVTIRKYIHENEIESIKLGGRYYISEEALEKFMEHQHKKIKVNLEDALPALIKSFDLNSEQQEEFKTFIESLKNNQKNKS